MSDSASLLLEVDEDVLTSLKFLATFSSQTCADSGLSRNDASRMSWRPANKVEGPTFDLAKLHVTYDIFANRSRALDLIGRRAKHSTGVIP